MLVGFNHTYIELNLNHCTFGLSSGLGGLCGYGDFFFFVLPFSGGGFDFVRLTVQHVTD